MIEVFAFKFSRVVLSFDIEFFALESCLTLFIKKTIKPSSEITEGFTEKLKYLGHTGCPKKNTV